MAGTPTARAEVSPDGPRAAVILKSCAGSACPRAGVGRRQRPGPVRLAAPPTDTFPPRPLRFRLLRLPARLSPCWSTAGWNSATPRRGRLGRSWLLTKANRNTRPLDPRHPKLVVGSADGRRLLASPLGTDAHDVWVCDGGRRWAHRLPGDERGDRFVGMAFSPDGTLAVTAQKHFFRLWRASRRSAAHAAGAVPGGGGGQRRPLLQRRRPLAGGRRRVNETSGCGILAPASPPRRGRTCRRTSSSSARGSALLRGRPPRGERGSGTSPASRATIAELILQAEALVRAGAWTPGACRCRCPGGAAPGLLARLPGALPRGVPADAGRPARLAPPGDAGVPAGERAGRPSTTSTTSSRPSPRSGRSTKRTARRPRRSGSSTVRSRTQPPPGTQARRLRPARSSAVASAGRR